MLKRLQMKKNIRQPPIISPPYLMETTTPDFVSLTTDVDWQPQLDSSTTKRPPPSAARINTKTIPTLESLQQGGPLQYRPASSVYSQPSPTTRSEEFQSTDDSELVSPSSPEAPSPSYRRGEIYSYYPEELISPIDEGEESEDAMATDKEPETPKTRKSLVTRRERKINEAATYLEQVQARRNTRVEQESHRVGQKKSSAAPRYDPYTGEPTTDEKKGRPQQVKPSNFNGAEKPFQDVGPDGLDLSPVTGGPGKKTPAATIGTTFADRLRKLRDNRNNNTTTTTANRNAPEVRPAWKGASGRQPLISPPTELVNPKTFSIPRKPSQRDLDNDDDDEKEDDTSDPSNDKDEEAGITTTASSSFFSRPTETHPALRNANLYERRYPPPGVRDVSEYRIPTQNFNASPLSTTLSRTAQPTLTASLRPPTPPRLEDLPDISVGIVERNFRQALKESQLVPNTSPKTQSPPRPPGTTPTDPTPDENNYTWTMPSQAPALPAANNNIPRTQWKPRIDSLDGRRVSARKPVPTSPTLATSPRTLQPDTSSILSSSDKKLPLTPSERTAQTQDTIAQLQSQSDELRRRRQNLESAIRQMTELMPQDGLMGGIGGARVGGGHGRHYIVGQAGPAAATASVMTKRFTEKRREEEKLKVQELRSELADVRIREHETGLRLHRAYKRSEAPGHQPSHLWVRRITG